MSPVLLHEILTIQFIKPFLNSRPVRLQISTSILSSKCEKNSLFGLAMDNGDW